MNKRVCKLNYELIFILYFIMILIGAMHNEQTVWLINFIFSTILFVGGKKDISFEVCKPKDKATWLFFSYFVYGCITSVIAYLCNKIVIMEIMVLVFSRVLIVINVYLIIMLCNMEKILESIKNMGFVFCVIGIFELIYKKNIFIFWGRPFAEIVVGLFEGPSYFIREQIRTQSAFKSPLLYSVFLIFVWIILLYFPYKKKIVNLIAQILILVNLLGTQARSSCIILIAISIWHLWYTRKTASNLVDKSNYIASKVIVMGGSVTLIALIILSSVLVSNRVNMFGFDISRFNIKEMMYSQSFIARVKPVIDVAQNFIYDTWDNKILGHGVGTGILFVQEHPAFVRGEEMLVFIENPFTAAMYEYGIIGLGLLVAFAISVLIISYKGSKCLHLQVSILLLLSLVLNFLFANNFVYHIVILLMSVGVGLVEKNKTCKN